MHAGGSRLAAEKLGGDVVVSAVADEEHASIGTRSVLERLRTDAAIVTEPTGLGVCIAHKGFVWAEIEVEGRAAHGSRPAEGRDAITAMALSSPVLRSFRPRWIPRPAIRWWGPGPCTLR